MLSADERITAEFASWALRGQGVALWPEPVTPEPAFTPFRRSSLEPQSPVDDGRRPTLLSSFMRRLSDGLAAPTSTHEPNWNSHLVPRWSLGSDMVELQVLSSTKQAYRREDYECFFASIAGCAEPVAFEILTEAEGIGVQFAASRGDMSHLRSQLEAFFPDSVYVEREGELRRSWDNAKGEYFAAVEFGLEREFVLPLRPARLDLFLGLSACLGGLQEGEMGVFQVITESLRYPWAAHALRSVSDGAGSAVFDNAPELFAGAKEKVSLPLFAAVVRVAFRGADAARIEELVSRISGAINAFLQEGGNRFVSLSNKGYSAEDHAEDVLARESRRSGMILNAHELAALVHLPSAEVRSPTLIRHDRPTRPAPGMVCGEQGLLLGHNLHAGTKSQVRLSPDQRLRHTHIVGASGTGKSTLFFNLIQQDILSGSGLAVLDPHGDLIDRILGIIPPERIKDVVLLDPSDLEFPVGFNILHAHSELEKTLLASDLVSVFERLSTSWGDQMGSVLSHAVLAFLESNRGGSLLDLRRFLLEPEFRASFLTTVRDPEVTYYWRHGFSQLSGNKSVGPILTRLETFLMPKSIRAMVGQRENRLNFSEIMDHGKIFLAKLSQGAIGRENSYLLGTLLVSKFQQLAVARQGVAEKERRDFHLYMDEFHNFITPSMAEILSGARKYRLGLVLAHQELRQLERDREVSSAVLGNAYTRICFRVGDSDARTLEAGFSHYTAKDLQNLGTGEAICRVERSDYDFNLQVSPPVSESDDEAASRKQEAIAASRAAYGRRLVEQAEDTSVSTDRQEALPPVVAAAKSSTIEPRAQLPVSETKPAATKPPIVPSPGRGGKEHKYLQTFIKQWAEGMGWRTAIEASVKGGTGSVDVLLSKKDMTIACEISVTTSVEHEIRNLEKCARAGYAYVVSVCGEERRAREIEAEAKKSLGDEMTSRMRFFTPAQLFSFVSEIDAKNASTDTTTKGYRVKVNYRPVDGAVRAERMEAVASVIAKSLRRMKDKPQKP